MDKHEAQMVGFEIVAYSGDARSQLLNALKEAKEGNFVEADKLVDEAKQSLVDAHNSQSKMLSMEAAGEDIELGFIMVHGQDHLMTTLLLQDVIQDFIELYKRTNK
ncbi:PTS lactose/cellobiose transporter subunit IIA [Aerococcus tenax]|uniref:PTS lactose/cellobiose transporter subunit IIA n=1 Tax=Aerococcus tenax TaxID=3078812 RepID=UPI0018A7C0CC|nr:PTS lactose/cellobiose transporter subunit IIA [Aerococcus tenax]